MGRFFQLLFLLVFSVPFLCDPGLLRADISITPPGSKGSDSNRKGGISSTVLARPVQGQVIRGGEVDLPIDAIAPNGGDVLLQISRSPRFGSLQPLGRGSASALVYRYVNDSKFNSGEDSFEFRIKAPGQAWRTHTAAIGIKAPPGVLTVTPGKLDFGKVAIGSTARRTIVLCNNFGAPVSGTLLLPAPWSLVGDGSYTLAEKETRSFEIQFKPTEAKAENSQLKAAPELPGFPIVPVFGEGIVPFMIDTNSAVIDREHFKAVFRVTNPASSPIKIEWEGDTVLELSPGKVIPPHGVVGFSVALGQLVVPVESRITVHLFLSTRAFSMPVEITALGPPGEISVEALHGSEIVAASLEHSLTLRGIIHNASSRNHEVQLALHDSEESPSTSGSSLNPLSPSNPLIPLHLPPSSSIPFELPWTPRMPGLWRPSVQLLESGKVLGTAAWNVSVHTDVTPSPHPPSHSAETISLKSARASAPSPQTRLATSDEKENLAIWMPPYFKEGLLRRSLVLRWQYAGSNNQGFVISEQRHKNSLMDRTGEAPTDSWMRMKGTPTLNGGIWELELPLPFPGAHVFLVYPDGQGEKIISPLTVGITWKMFVWPALRLLLAAIFIVSLVKVIRRRNSGRRGR
ncbi:MAG: hypothetical protein WCR44_07960 [Verrucomicrobiota bacterium]